MSRSDNRFSRGRREMLYFLGSVAAASLAGCARNSSTSLIGPSSSSSGATIPGSTTGICVVTPESMRMRLCCALFGFLLAASTVAAQLPVAIPSNPRAMEFVTAAVDDRWDVVGFRLEIFPNGLDTEVGQSIRSMEFQKSASTGGSVRIELGPVLDGLSDGLYIATVRSLARRGESPRSAPTTPFAVTGLADRPSPPAVVLPIFSGPTLPVSTPSTVITRSANEPRSRFWTIVGIVIAAAVIAPLLWRKRPRPPHRKAAL
jgi:hypothetical protein